MINFLWGLFIGVIIGQLSVWRHLRKKKTTQIGEWIYKAEKEVNKND